MNKTRKIFKPAYILIGIAIVAILVIRFFYGTIISVSGRSMYPTFESGGYVFGTFTNPNTELQRGDIVIASVDNMLVIKRIVGLPGDTIQDSARDIPFTRLGEDEYFLVGDNYEVSIDSRSFGPVSRSAIVYKYSYIYWSLTDMIVTFGIPIVLLLAAFTIVFVHEKKESIPRLHIQQKAEA